MDFLKLLQNKNFSPVVEQTMAPPKQEPKVTKQENNNAPGPNDSYKVKSSTGKEFTRRRKQSSSQYYSMDDDTLLKSYDDAVNGNDDRKRKRTLYYIKKRGLKVRQLRRKLNGSE
jgi:hypothetical protein